MKNESTGITKQQRYAMKIGDAEKMANLAGKTVTVDAWMKSHKSGRDGEVYDILAIYTDGKAYVTNSPSFTERFADIAEFRDDSGDSDSGFRLEILRKMSKGGREYLSCNMVD